ncbi:MAG TPA: CZB domain-containing protein [Stellaceae bacterium]|nr:CZB domain-containing protein [Stellaceae bacterium]
MKFRTQIDKAIGAHSHWKKRLMRAIETSESALTPDQVARHDACEVGRWLESASIPEARRTADFEACRELHAEFHKAAADVLRLAAAGNRAAALAALGSDSRFANLSSTLTLRMMQWAASLR